MFALAWLVTFLGFDTVSRAICFMNWDAFFLLGLLSITWFCSAWTSRSTTSYPRFPLLLQLGSDLRVLLQRLFRARVARFEGGLFIGCCIIGFALSMCLLPYSLQRLDAHGPHWDSLWLAPASEVRSVLESCVGLPALCCHSRGALLQPFCPESALCISAMS